MYTGLEGLHDLRELVLDRNKIKTITENSFVSQWNLQELHMEENRLVAIPRSNFLIHLVNYIWKVLAVFVNLIQTFGRYIMSLTTVNV